MSSNDLGFRPRSYLYAPADRPEVVAKALASGAHVVIADLEDGLRDGDPTAARALFAEFLNTRAPENLKSAALHVRVNRADGQDGWNPDDLTVAVHKMVSGIRLPKAESATALTALDATLTKLETKAGIEPGSTRVYPLIESAAGVTNAVDMARAPRVQTLCLGGADLSADLGIGTAENKAFANPLGYVRSTLLLAARAAGLMGPIDTVTTNLNDLDQVKADAQEARRCGFSGKSLIHPKHLMAIHGAFMPSSEEVAQAQAVVAAWELARAAGQNTATVDGLFIDAPIAARAIQVIEEYQLHG